MRLLRLGLAGVVGGLIGTALSTVSASIVMFVGGVPGPSVRGWLSIGMIPVFQTIGLGYVLSGILGGALGLRDSRSARILGFALAGLLPIAWLLVMVVVFPRARVISEGSLWVSAPLFLPPFVIGAVVGAVGGHCVRWLSVGADS